MRNVTNKKPTQSMIQFHVVHQNSCDLLLSLRGHLFKDAAQSLNTTKEILN